MKKSELHQFTHSHSLTLLKLSLGEKFSADLKELAAKGATDGSDGLSQTVPLAPGDASKRPRRSGGLSLMAPTDGSDGIRRRSRWGTSRGGVSLKTAEVDDLRPLSIE